MSFYNCVTLSCYNIVSVSWYNRFTLCRCNSVPVSVPQTMPQVQIQEAFQLLVRVTDEMTAKYGKP